MRSQNPLKTAQPAAKQFAQQVVIERIALPRNFEDRRVQEIVIGVSAAGRRRAGDVAKGMVGHACL